MNIDLILWILFIIIILIDTAIIIYYWMIKLYYSGPRIASRGKVNEQLLTGLRIVDAILPIGRGQRQLFLGDRGTGKTYIVTSILIYNSRINYLSSMDGFGAKRLFGFYIGLNQNLSKIYLLFIINFIDWRLNIIISTSSTSTSMMTFSLPLLAITFSEYYRDRGFDIWISFDDLIKHAKSYRQLSLLIGSIPSRQSYPSSIFNIHSSFLERCGRLNARFSSGSICSFPIIETINSDISEYISTNVISITDGQCFLNKALFNSSIRPSIDSSLSVSRIGSAAQSSFLASLSSGIKNEITLYRQSLSLSSISIITTSSTMALSQSIYNSIFSFTFYFYLFYSSINIDVLFYQHLLFISSIDFSILTLLFFSLFSSIYSIINFIISIHSVGFFGYVIHDWIITMPNRLIILTYLNALSNHNIILCLFLFISLFILLLLYLITISISSINIKSYSPSNYFLLYLLHRILDIYLMISQ